MKLSPYPGERMPFHCRVPRQPDLWMGLQQMRPGGFEPPTYRLEGGCSIQLSYGRLIN